MRVECTLFYYLQSRARTHAVLVIDLYELVGNPTTYLIEPPGPSIQLVSHIQTIWYCRFVFLLSKMFLSVMHRCRDDRQRSFHAHCRVGDVLIIIHFTITVKCRTAIKTLFLYLLNFCLSLNLESFSCSFTSIYFLSYNNSFSDNTYKLQLLLIGTVQKSI